VKEKAAVAEESTVQESSPDAVGSKDAPNKAATEDVEEKHQLTKVERFVCPSDFCWLVVIFSRVHIFSRVNRLNW
jgi:hypothetical protein